MRAITLALPLALLVACNKQPMADGAPNGPAVSYGSPTNNLNALPLAEKVKRIGTLPPASDPTRFVGSWAADEKSCQSKAWQFTASSLKTPAGSSCTFSRITNVPGGYDIEAVCTAEGPPSPDMLKIRFAESAKAMLLDSKTIASTGLVYCGRQA